MPRPLPAQLMDTSIPGLGTSPALAHLEQLGPRIRMSRALATSAPLANPVVPPPLPTTPVGDTTAHSSTVRQASAAAPRSAFHAELLRRLDSLPERTAQAMHRILGTARMQGCHPGNADDNPQTGTGSPVPGESERRGENKGHHVWDATLGVLDAASPMLPFAQGMANSLRRSKSLVDSMERFRGAWKSYTQSDQPPPSPDTPPPLPQKPPPLPLPRPYRLVSEEMDRHRRIAAEDEVQATPPTPRPRPYKLKPEDMVPPVVRRPPTSLATAALPQAYALQDDAPVPPATAVDAAKTAIHPAPAPTRIRANVRPATQLASGSVRRPPTMLAAPPAPPVAQEVQNPRIGPAFLPSAIPVPNPAVLPTRRRAVLVAPGLPSAQIRRPPTMLAAPPAPPVAQEVQNPRIGPAFLPSAIPAPDAPVPPTRRRAVLHIGERANLPRLFPDAPLPLSPRLPVGGVGMGGPTMTGKGAVNTHGLPQSENRLERAIDKLTRAVEALEETMDETRGKEGKTQAQPESRHPVQGFPSSARGMGNMPWMRDSAPPVPDVDSGGMGEIRRQLGNVFGKMAIEALAAGS